MKGPAGRGVSQEYIVADIEEQRGWRPGEFDVLPREDRVLLTAHWLEKYTAREEPAAKGRKTAGRNVDVDEVRQRRIAGKEAAISKARRGR